MERVIIWHNPQCGTSRNVLAVLRAAGLAPEVVDYRARGWEESELRDLLASAGLTARQALRIKGTEAEALGLTDPAATEEAILAAMLRQPALVERPFVRTARGTALCRPSGKVLDLIGTRPEGVELRPDGSVRLVTEASPPG